MKKKIPTSVLLFIQEIKELEAHSYRRIISGIKVEKIKHKSNHRNLKVNINRFKNVKMKCQK